MVLGVCDTCDCCDTHGAVIPASDRDVARRTTVSTVARRLNLFRRSSKRFKTAERAALAKVKIIILAK